MNLGKRLKELRGHRSGSEVAKAVGVSSSSLRMYETNRRVPRDTVKVRIANYYGTTVQSLFFDGEVT